MKLPSHLPLSVVAPGSEWTRIHSRSKEALWFGPEPGRPPIHRFDDPEGRFRVCYFGATFHASFSETFLRNPPVRTLLFQDLAERHLSTILVRRAIRLVRLYGAGLARVGVTAELAAGASYEFSQQCARAIWDHPEEPDGIAYHSRHDDSAICIALFDRARPCIELRSAISLTADPRLLGKILNRYGLGLLV